MPTWRTGWSRIRAGEAPYASTGTGNFDLYLPFIEKGLTLLDAGGRMGYIAPNLWPTLEYGAGLRGLVHAGRHLEKWLDFRSFQVFEEATVYTAIQIFSKAPVDAIRLAFAGRWRPQPASIGPTKRLTLPYERLSNARCDPWLIAPAPVRGLIERFGRQGAAVGSAGKYARRSFRALITSADHIYHLRRRRTQSLQLCPA